MSIKKLASFDLETARITEQGEEMTNLGISCAGVALTGGLGTVNNFYHAPGQLSKDQACDLVLDLLIMKKDGYTTVTWNGTGFDFRILAEESGMWEECAELAMNHVDMMLFVTFTKGYYLGLDTALRGMGVAEKLHEVTLKNGTVVSDFSGAKAPELWAAGEYEAVLEYLKGDIEQPLELAQKIIDQKCIKWTSGKGNPMYCAVPKFRTVKEMFKLSKPNTSWMTDPPTREQFIEWMP